MKKKPGQTYLHRHRIMEARKRINKKHVIVDRKDWEEVVVLLENNLHLINPGHEFIRSQVPGGYTIDIITNPMITPKGKGILFVHPDDYHNEDKKTPPQSKGEVH